MDLTAFLDTLADAACEAIMPHFRQETGIDNKLSDGFDPVTVADRKSEAAMRALIEAHFPEHGIIGEEFGDTSTDAERIWVLDPIDGTRAFISGLPVWGVLIGHKLNGMAERGMMCQPFTGERYLGTPEGAWLKHKGVEAKLQTRACPDIAAATLFTTSPDLFQPQEIAAYRHVERMARLARYGTDCYAYCMVASGHADIVIESGLNPYDIVALIPIIEGAGGRISTWDGGNAVNGGSIVATGDPTLHEKVLEELNFAL